MSYLLSIFFSKFILNKENGIKRHSVNANNIDPDNMILKLILNCIDPVNNLKQTPLNTDMKSR